MLPSGKWSRRSRALTRELSQENALGLFYFADHGLELDGDNWLVPVVSVKVGCPLVPGLDPANTPVDAFSKNLQLPINSDQIDSPLTIIYAYIRL